jgi:uncharacterized membrane protein
MFASGKDSVSLISNYLARIKAGLKGIDKAQQREILAEIRSHLTDRVEQLEMQGSLRSAEDAIEALGDPDELSVEFMRAAAVRASYSHFPWVLLRGALRLVFTGLRGTLVFAAGLAGYGAAICFTAAGVAKLMFPARVGFWVGPHGGVIWGYQANASAAHELAGQSFLYISIVLAFLFATGTTLSLKKLLRSSGSAKTPPMGLGGLRAQSPIAL